MSRKRQREDHASEDVFVYYEHTSLRSIPIDISSVRIDGSVRRIAPRAFSQRKKLTTVQYEEGLQVIGEHAFSGCTSLREQQFPSTLIEIGNSAFNRCERLESVGRFPLSLTTIRADAFTRCTKLQSSIEITNDKLLLEEGVFVSCSSLTMCRLPRGMVTIPKCLFRNCYSLVDVNIPSSVIEIGCSAFAHCRTLAEIELPAGLKTIGDYAFASTGIKHFHCPIAMESMDDCALTFCKDLESVILPPKLEAISESAFNGCVKLKDVSIPQSIVAIYQAAFTSCAGLTQLDLSRFTITEIGPFAFAHCSNLRNIMLPRRGLKRIEERSFENCISLTHLWVPSTVECIDNGALVGCESLLSLEVPETLKRLIFVGWDHDEYDEELGDDEGELCGYESLVNIYIPPSHQLDDVERFNFMRGMKLGEAESSYPELVDKLKRRFNSLPLHRACYFQSYHSLQANVQKIQSIVQSDEDGPARACERVDFLGMTPFHILALSHRPWLNLFQELLSISSSAMDIILKCRDVFGCTPLDYLCKNIHSPAAVSVTKSLLLQILEPRIGVLGLELWRNDMMSDLDKVLQMAPTVGEDDESSSLSTKVTSLCQKLALLERMEVLSLLEMSVWKMKIIMENVTPPGSDADARENCRINCGSRVVLENVIPLLGTG